MYLALFIIELFGLYLISKKLTESVFLFFFILTRSRAVAITIITILMFPGTVIHELSHLFTAAVLGVRVGKLELAPESIRSERVQMGSVSIAQTDPVRRYAIGFAPITSGTILLCALSYFFFTPSLTIPH